MIRDRSRGLCALCTNVAARVGAMFALLVIAAATPVALASHKPPKKPASVPDCAHFSLARLAQRIHVSSVVLQGKTPGINACTYTASVPGEYSDILQISVVPATRCVRIGRPFPCYVVFVNAEKLAKKVAAQRHAEFGEIGARNREGIAPVYYVSNFVNGESASLRPCDPPAPPLFLPPSLPEFGPPLCFGEPDWSSITVSAYGRLDPRGPTAFVSVGLAGATRKVVLHTVSNLDLSITSTGIR
jgi:hypothetical protein